MGSEIQVKHHSSLESNSDVGDTLNWKLEALKKEERPLEEGIADYIGFTLDNLNQSIASKKFYIEELRKLIKMDEVQTDNIKIEGVKFLEQMGVEKLQGHIVSSVSIIKAKPSTTKTKEVLKYLVSKEEIDELLVTLGKAEWETVTTTTDAVPQKMRVTARRVKHVEIEDVN